MKNEHSSPNPRKKVNNHRCPDWDYLLIDDSMPEYKVCTCPKDGFGYLFFEERCKDPMCACNDREFLDP